MPRFLLPLTALAFLASCGPGQDPSAPVTMVESDEMIPVEPDGGIGDGTGPIPAAASTIPEKFQGVWDYEKGTCSLESDLRMVVGENDIRFYESYGKVTDVRLEDEDAIIDLAMEGEGEAWDNTVRLSFNENGDRLLGLNVDGSGAEDALPLVRCPE